MKTLKQLRLSKYKTSNFADYRNSCICCGWMEIHEDKDNLGDSNNPFFTVKPLYWDDEAVFIFKPHKKWHSLSKEDFLAGKKIAGLKINKESFVFDARKYHALVPNDIAKKLKADPEFEKTQEYKNFAESCCKEVSPKLVWKWND